jgi:hypothetical protein
VDYNEGKLFLEQKVEDFNRNEKIYLDKTFQETENRTRFINPLFQSLGWNFNQTNIARQYWDVHQEFSQKDSSSTKKPDYAFRIDKKVKFFVEAKAPWVPLTDKAPVFQAKRYAFSTNGKAPIVILTDFQEFRVFNSLKRPLFDNPLDGLLKDFDLTYNQYLDNWDLLWNTFSKEAISNGSLDLLRNQASKNTKTLDVEFLNDLTLWREILAKNIAIRNESLTVDEINEAVQRILDRLVFIRNLEDKEIEPENLIINILKSKDDVEFTAYKSMIPLFNRMDSDYNGLLFKKHFSEELNIDNKIIREIINNMSYPISPFQFDVIEPEILGRIYEKFLGSKIRLTDSHRAKVEEKPEVRHAGGVYYTPVYIVNYIVEKTVGEKIKNKKPEEISKVKILDPACGSGSFLIGAFQCLIQYHKKWYSENLQAKKYKDDYYVDENNEIHLTLKKKGDILVNNLFGVDIDREATEVAMMSLYLKMLEEGFDRGEGILFKKDSILPDLTNNIKCGNSLVSSDYYAIEGNSLFDKEQSKKINPFVWEDEFTTVIKSGGFDIIIGNPPYIRVQELDYSFIDYCKSKFKIAWKRIDISILFIELANKLLKNDGLNCYITSNQFLSTEYGRKARAFLLSEANIQRIVDFGDLPIFQKALTYVSIFILGKGKSNNFPYHKIIHLDEDIEDSKSYQIDFLNLNDEPWILENPKKVEILNKLKNRFKSLDNYGKCWAGLFTGKDEVLMFDETDLAAVPFEKEILLPVIRAQDCQKYGYSNASKYVIYPYSEENDKTGIITEKELSTKFPKAYDYLKQHKGSLLKRKDSRKEFSENKAWYSLTRFGKYSIFHKPKIVSPGEVKDNKFALDTTGAGFSCARVFAITAENPNVDLKALLGILNSKLIEFYLHSVAPLKQGGYYSYSSSFIDSGVTP